MPDIVVLPNYISNLTTSTQGTIVTLLKIAKKKFSKPKGETRTSFIFPLLHQNVVNAISHKITSTRFHKKDSNRDFNNKYSTYVMGKFKCNNNACSTGGQGSKKVAILIKEYPRNGYNAIVFNQHCKSCNQLSTLTLDKKLYINQVTYRLKKQAGILIKQQYYASKEGLPHERDLCKGYKRGVYQQINNWEYY